MVKRSVIRELNRRIGAGKVFNQREFLLSYAYDATRLEFMPDAVVFPESQEDIAAIIDLARQQRIPLVPRGAGAGYSGGALAVHGGLVMAFTRMNRILKIDRRSLLAEVEPGVVTADLQARVEKIGLFYPPDPASLKTSTIGGNVAENAGGPRCFKYGVTGNYVLGLDAFLMSGEKLHLGAHTVKNVAGYDLKSLLVGSEGTLAVIAKIVLRLIVLPPRRLLARIDLASLAEAARFVQELVTSRVTPSVLEFIDRSALTAVYRYLRRRDDLRVKASILVELDGSHLEVEEKKNLLLKKIRQVKPIRFRLAAGAAEQEKLWEIRRAISPAINTLKPMKINEDVVVPIGRIPAMVEFITRLGKTYHIAIVLFGHFGDGNIHTNLLVDPSDPGEMKRAAQVLEELFRQVVVEKGTISGEHGIGLSKKPFMPFQFSPAELEIFHSLKKVFDPLNLLNPGKIF